MKKILLTLSLLLLLGEMFAKPIVIISRARGFFGMYARVEQNYLGIFEGRDCWSLICQNPGLNSCRLHYVNMNTGTLPGNGGFTDYEATN